MVLLADQGKGFWCRIHDGQLLTPTAYAALPSTANVAFVAIPFGALGETGEGDEREFILRDGMLKVRSHSATARYPGPSLG